MNETQLSGTFMMIWKTKNFPHTVLSLVNTCKTLTDKEVAAGLRDQVI